MVINIVLNLILMGPLAHGGLALATSLSAMINFLSLLYLIQNRLGKLDTKKILLSLSRNVFACLLIIGICVWISKQDLWLMQGNWGEKIVLVSGSVILSTAAYLTVHYLIKSEEFLFFRNLMKEKILKKKQENSP